MIQVLAEPLNEAANPPPSGSISSRRAMPAASIWILRQGRIVGGRRTADTNGRELVDLITGVMHSDEDLGG